MPNRPTRPGSRLWYAALGVVERLRAHRGRRAGLERIPQIRESANSKSLLGIDPAGSASHAGSRPIRLPHLLGRRSAHGGVTRAQQNAVPSSTGGRKLRSRKSFEGTPSSKPDRDEPLDTRPYALHLRGEITAHPDRWRPEEAEECYCRALAISEPGGVGPLVAHCHLGLGKLYQRTGKREEAQRHLTTATTMYRETY